MSETMTEMKLRFNKEKSTWIFGLEIWLICFMAIQILMIPFPWLRYAGIVINIILLIIVFSADKKVKQGIKLLERNIE